jgi:hypothetical protein
VAALPVTDTLKRADAEGRVLETLDRASIWAMQTPQVFRYSTLLAAHEAAAEGAEATDDAALVEQLGEPIHLVPGEETNLKVTTPADLAIVEALLARREGAVRVGHGFDAHRLAPGRPCVLGGVTVPHPSGPAGHSDADVATHAIMDAVLGALALGDLGRHFPDSDPVYAGISSLELARRVAALAAERGYRAARGRDARAAGGGVRLRPGVGEREGHDHRGPGLHRPRRRDRGARGGRVARGGLSGLDSDAGTGGEPPMSTLIQVLWLALGAIVVVAGVLIAARFLGAASGGT